MRIACVLLAAGSSRRMLGANKLLLDDGGASVLRRAAEAVQAARFSETLAVTGFDHEKTARELDLLRVVHNPQFQNGMHASIRVGLANLHSHYDFVAICLGDQPALTVEDFNHLIEKAIDHKSKLLITPLFDGLRGHPTLIASSLVPEVLREPDSDQGCRYLFQRYPDQVGTVEMPSANTLIDVDTREAFDLYRETSQWKS